MRYVYLHGFASSPQSRKATAFSSALASVGVHLEVPELDAGDFEHLTISSQLSVIGRLLQGDPARVIGSSMGGYLASLYASTHPEVDRLVLLAPAFHFAARWREIAGPGSMDVFHYGSGTMRRLDQALLSDALGYAPAPDFAQPALLFHGRGDTVVPIEFSRQFAAAHRNVDLLELDSGHELTDVLDTIVSQAVAFVTA